MDKRQKLLIDWANKFKKSLIVSDIVDVMDEIVKYMEEERENSVSDAVRFAVIFFEGAACGEQSKMPDGETSFFVLFHDTIINMFASRHGYAQVYPETLNKC